MTYSPLFPMVVRAIALRAASLPAFRLDVDDDGPIADARASSISVTPAILRLD
jgi:hypothetical protein